MASALSASAARPRVQPRRAEQRTAGSCAALGRFVPSSRHPRIGRAVAGVGMFGDGATHGKPVAAKGTSRDHPRAGHTTRSRSSRRSAAKRRASSPAVIPWRTGIGCRPTKVR
jgi:hypothetical protein